MVDLYKMTNFQVLISNIFPLLLLAVPDRMLL